MNNSITITIDCREKILFELCNEYVNTHNIKNVILESKNLPIGDIIISCKGKELIIIERKSLQDLASSIKDGRYNEQSFRLTNCNVHNHNIIYLIEGDWSHYSNGKFNKSINQHTLMSSIISINYYKGFSIYRTLNISESALYIVYLADKLQRENTKKTPYYINDNNEEEIKTLMNSDMDLELQIKENVIDFNKNQYSQVIKKVKKDNITIHNIGEILLSQIPNVSNQSAVAIMHKFKTIKNLIYNLEKDDKCLDDIITDKHRKLNKTCKTALYKYLLHKENEIIIK